MMKYKYTGFTLVELIIVITILAIISTIAFVSFQNYISDSRDSSRITSLKNIEKSLQVFQISTGNYPEPENKVNIFSSGVVVGFQGNVANLLSKLLKINNVPKDPLDLHYYSYGTNKEKNKYVLSSLNEKKYVSAITQSYGSNTVDRIPKIIGDKISVIFDTNLIPIEQSDSGVDLVTTSNEYISYVLGNKIMGSGNVLKVVTSFYGLSYAKSCKEILDAGGNLGNGVYNLNPSSSLSGTFATYCDMTTDGGGWTLFYANNGRDDSQIKKSFIQMRNDIYNSSIRYDLTKYTSDILAGLNDYRSLIEFGGSKELLYIDNTRKNNSWVKATFNSSGSFLWTLEKLGDANAKCETFPNSGSWKFDKNGVIGGLEETSTGIYFNQVLFHYGMSLGLSHSLSELNCNGFTQTIYPHAFFYVAGESPNDRRTRSCYLSGGCESWGGPNQYRYFLR